MGSHVTVKKEKRQFLARFTGPCAAFYFYQITNHGPDLLLVEALDLGLEPGESTSVGPFGYSINLQCPISSEGVSNCTVSMVVGIENSR